MSVLVCVVVGGAMKTVETAHAKDPRQEKAWSVGRNERGSLQEKKNDKWWMEEQDWG